MRHHLRIANLGILANSRPNHGPADNLLAEIQAETLTRHPDWRYRLQRIKLEAHRDAGGSSHRNTQIRRP